jgi:chemotaxis protein MotB
MPGLSRRRRASALNVWPGFVDALSSLLLVIIFVLLVFVLTQFYLGAQISGRDDTIARMSRQLSQMTDVLELERRHTAELKETIGHMTDDLQALTTERDELQTKLTENGDLRGKLADERKLSDEARARAALMDQQLEAMRQELARLSSSLSNSEALSAEQKVEIANLGKRLNAALAGKVEELTRYRSEFFGRLRQLLGDRPGIKVEGDRFVFQSELLFASGSARPMYAGY